jgi:hypothetical protein
VRSTPGRHSAGRYTERHGPLAADEVHLVVERAIGADGLCFDFLLVLGDERPAGFLPRGGEQRVERRARAHPGHDVLVGQVLEVGVILLDEPGQHGLALSRRRRVAAGVVNASPFSDRDDGGPPHRRDVGSEPIRRPACRKAGRRRTGMRGQGSRPPSMNSIVQGRLQPPVLRNDGG